MRIAFFGGSFDPPHLGHVAIARAAADRLALDQVLFAPVGSQPLKSGAALASYADRLAMVTLAASSDPRFTASQLDQPRSDRTHNYTYDTLAAFKTTLSPDHQLYCLLGADSFQTLHHWRRAADLLLLCDFIIAARPGYPLPALTQQALTAQLPPGISITAQPSPAVFRLNDQTQLHLLPDLDQDISATSLRQALAQGNTAVSDTMLPPGVPAYIRTHHLYRESL
jgi:nicotinate-nucleotide adenylyltransferase